jgi:hypothetical protein
MNEEMDHERWLMEDALQNWEDVQNDPTAHGVYSRALADFQALMEDNPILQAAENALYWATGDYIYEEKEATLRRERKETGRYRLPFTAEDREEMESDRSTDALVASEHRHP